VGLQARFFASKQAGKENLATRSEELLIVTRGLNPFLSYTG